MYPPGPNDPRNDPYTPYGYNPYYGGPPYTPLPSVNSGLILTLGILSLFCVGHILGPIAWIMGNRALYDIDTGRADPSERGTASAGRACAIVSTVLHYGVVLAYLVIIIVALLSGNTGH